MNSIIGCAQNAFNNLCELKINNLELIKEISDNVLANEKVILEENRKDIEIKKGFELDFKFIKLLLNNLLNNKTLYKKKFLDKAKKEIIEYDNLGVLETFFDGNTYIFLEMIIKTLISNNAMIFISQKNYMKYTNSIIYEIIIKTLKNRKINEDIIQLVYDIDILKYCENNLILKKAFVVGNVDLHNTIKRVSKIDTKYIPYNDCDIYIENIENTTELENFINKNDNVLFKIYIKDSLNINTFDDAKYVKDFTEVIEKIRFDSCNYCLMLFSNNKQTKVQISEKCKEKYIVINKLMNFNISVGIDINEFYCKKCIIL